MVLLHGEDAPALSVLVLVGLDPTREPPEDERAFSTTEHRLADEAQ
jgi:hypothetical protein